jgi:L-lactate dehydrogenase (cytochrome)
MSAVGQQTDPRSDRPAIRLFCSPTALQRLFHHDGERAVAKAAEKFGFAVAQRRRVGWK